MVETLVQLYSVPAPGQTLRGEEGFLGTVRTFMHKASLTALSSGIKQVLPSFGIEPHVEIVDMQNSREKNQYGELNLGNNVVLNKFRVGRSFSSVGDKLKEPDIIGVNSNFTYSRRIVGDFLRFARRINPHALIVAGGTDSTADPEFYLRNGADTVVKGEGELTFSYLINAHLSRKPLENVPNITFNRDGSVVNTPQNFLRQFVDIDKLSLMDLDGVDLSLYTDTGEGNPPNGIYPPFISVETSRGCPQACTFCATPTTKGAYRFMSLDTIQKHLEYFKEKSITTLLFQEDNILSRVHRNPNGSLRFQDGRQHLLDLFKMVRDMGFSWEFTNGLEFGRYEHNGELDYELIDAMFWHKKGDGRLLGCYRAAIPLESLSEDTMRLFRKLKKFDTSKRIIEVLASTGVDALSFNLIIGRPEDTERVLMLGYDRCREVREIVESRGSTQSYFNIYIHSLLPNTGDFNRYKHLLAFDLERDPEVVTFYLGCMQTPSFSPLEITQARGTMAKLLNGDSKISDYDETNYITNRRFEKLLA